MSRNKILVYSLQIQFYNFILDQHSKMLSQQCISYLGQKFCLCLKMSEFHEEKDSCLFPDKTGQDQQWCMEIRTRGKVKILRERVNDEKQMCKFIKQINKSFRVGSEEIRFGGY